MRKISATTLIGEVANLCIRANYYASNSLITALKTAKTKETSALGQNVLGQIVKNAELAASNHVPMCQDTGMAVVFLDIGQDVFLEGNLEEAINEGVRLGYEKGYLRKSMVDCPLNRINTKDNTPAVIHYNIVPGDRLTITVAPKGGGAENMSALKMLKPSDDLEGIKEFVLKTVKEAGGNACPPLIVGVGIGGTMEKAAILAKTALLRPLEDESLCDRAKSLEQDLLKDINALDVGPMGFGGVSTALAVKVNTFGTHIASLPVAVNLQCHAARHEQVVL